MRSLYYSFSVYIILYVVLSLQYEILYVAGTWANDNHWADVVSIESGLIKVADIQPCVETEPMNTEDWKWAETTCVGQQQISHHPGSLMNWWNHNCDLLSLLIVYKKVQGNRFVLICIINKLRGCRKILVYKPSITTLGVWFRI